MDQRQSLPNRKRIPISLHTSFVDSTLPPDLRTALQRALLTPNSGAPDLPPQSSIPKIQKALSSALDDAQWNEKFEAYILQLVRSGELQGQDGVGSEEEFNAIMEQVMQQARGQEGLGKTARARSSIEVPESVLRIGIKTLRQELDRISEVVEVDD